MPRRSKVFTLPPAVKAWLDAALIEGNFTGYDLLVEELKTRGVTISKSSLQRYGAPMERMMHKVKLSGEQAQALMAGAGDDKGAVNDAIIRMIQQKTVELLLMEDAEAEDGNPTPSIATDPKFVRAIATLVRASVQQKEWSDKLRKEDAAKLAKIEAEAKASGGKKRGLDLETVQRIRRDVYGFGGA